jgi:hypothetical protein
VIAAKFLDLIPGLGTWRMFVVALAASTRRYANSPRTKASGATFSGSNFSSRVCWLVDCYRDGD